MVADPYILQFCRRLTEQFGTLPPPEDTAVQHTRSEAIATVSDCPDSSGIEASDLNLSLTGRTLDVIVFRPKGVATPRLLMWFHGGGWVVGASYTTCRMLAALLVQDTCYVAVSAGYRLTLEHAFPMSADDTHDAPVYLAEQRAHLGFAPDFIVVDGDSAGGHFAVQVTQDMRPGLVNMQFLLYPVTTSVLGGESYNAFVQGPGLTCDEIRWYWEKYISAEVLAKPLAEQDPRVFLMARPPVYTPSDTVVIAAAHDVLCGDDLQYVDHLVQHGAQVITIEISGMTHAFARIQLEAERTHEWTCRTAHAFMGVISGKQAGDRA